MGVIGVVGNGFVGNSIATGMFGFVDDVKIFDIDEARSVNTLSETVNESDVVFVSVPTPMRDVLGGEIDLTILENALQSISDARDGHNPVVVVKSTIVPGTMEKLQSEHSNLRLVFSPEFLTERYARLDFINSARIVLGGATDDVDVVEGILKPRFPGARFIKTDFATAQLIKYMANCFFSVKVSFMNEMKQISDAVGADWEDAIAGFISDGRIGNSHISVPGHDGSLGFGGKCFPKDLNALIYRSVELGVKPTVMIAAWSKNLEVRKNLDWAEIAGAVSEK
jgi:UDPglucose 6-dehydrogenase